MSWLLPNVLLMVVFFALWVGIPVWFVFRHPDTNPEAAAIRAVAYLPAHRHEDSGHRAA